MLIYRCQHDGPISKTVFGWEKDAEKFNSELRA